ncbi:CPBP family intramembrane glutamic endopeptidase [Natronosalvus halobius]|uniref:CPBP family intramembrane glutamic endopeptidase n=1 Tax=Natronosalvus halobius TaxID=2953746 RepID=UPI0020A10B23|nr:CPBP family intramembrane glutamic endopeptidase [Natronosalvus halobius]USZ71245.1 CPBP family intramembrane metalloprotease [Natronosalvus halobius]
MNTLKRTDGYARSVAVAALLTVGGILMSQLLTLPAILAEPGLIDEPTQTSYEIRSLFFILNFAGFVVAGAAYLWWTDRGWSFVDLSTPDRRGWLIGVAGVVASIAFVILVGLLFQGLGIESTSNSVLDFVGTDSTMVLIMIVIVFLFNAPAEEFLFRGVIQKRLYEGFTKTQAVVLTSVIFGLVHIPNFALSGAPMMAAVASLLVVTGGSIIFGYLYAITDNLLVPITAHAMFNAFQFGQLYLIFEYGDEEMIEEVTSGTAMVLEVATTLG